jgi:hypothetical protein
MGEAAPASSPGMPELPGPTGPGGMSVSPGSNTDIMQYIEALMSQGGANPYGGPRPGFSGTPPPGASGPIASGPGSVPGAGVAGTPMGFGTPNPYTSMNPGYTGPPLSGQAGITTLSGPNPNALVNPPPAAAAPASPNPFQAVLASLGGSGQNSSLRI